MLNKRIIPLTISNFTKVTTIAEKEIASNSNLKEF